ncbi:hypothetical protein P5V15_014563 [Pogonomyrmex californicus]
MRATSISTSVEIALRCVGLWPDLPYGTVTWYTYMTSLVFALYFQYAYIFGHFEVNNISNLIDALSITLSYSLSFLKLLSLWSNRRIFYDILLAIKKDWSDVNICDKSVSYIMTSNAELSRLCSNVLISINATAAICYSMANLLRSTDLKEDLNVSLRVLPIKMEFPFEVDASPLFEMLAVGQILHVVSIASIVGMINCLVVTLVLHVSGQIDILCQELLTICGDGTLQDNLIVASVRLLIIKHQKIITLSENIEELYSDIALMQILSNTVVICCIGFTIIGSLTKEGATVMMLKSAIFYVAITLEAFIFCFAGEYLSAKSKSIGDAVYETLWYDMTPAECRILLFVILRSQKRLTITAGNVMDLSLEGFTSVMKASASYMSVLHAMY